MQYFGVFAAEHFKIMPESYPLSVSQPLCSRKAAFFVLLHKDYIGIIGIQLSLTRHFAFSTFIKNILSTDSISYFSMCRSIDSYVILLMRPLIVKVPGTRQGK